MTSNINRLMNIISRVQRTNNISCHWYIHKQKLIDAMNLLVTNLGIFLRLCKQFSKIQALFGRKRLHTPMISAGPVCMKWGYDNMLTIQSVDIYKHS